MIRAAAALSLVLTGCAATTAPRPRVESELPAPATGWQAIASPEDQVRIAAIGDTLARARASVGRRGAAALSREGALLDPAAALPQPLLPPGPYHCRLLRFGGAAGLRSFAPDFCYVEIGEVAGAAGLSFTKQTGSNLPQGWLYPDGDTRQVFLGTLRTGGTAHPYGHDPARDIAGVVERVSPFRWRLILTRAGRGAALDLYELVPVTPDVPGAKPAIPAG